MSFLEIQLREGQKIGFAAFLLLMNREAAHLINISDFFN